MVVVPVQLANNVTGVHGARGTRWLEQLPDLIANLEARWSIRALPPSSCLSYNYVVPVLGCKGAELKPELGAEFILKVGVPHPELQTEIQALRHFDGRRCVRLVEADSKRGALLLERLRPGTPLLEERDDDQATRIAARIMSGLWRTLPEKHPFPTVARWAEGLVRLRACYGGGTGPFPRDLVESAEILYDELIASQAEPVLLHGDLHHENVLSARREPWLAIDPKGLVGEPAYEVGALLRNPYPRLLSMPQPRRILSRRLDILASELGLERQRMLGWALAQSMLSAWWHVEDRTNGRDYALACARVLSDLKP